MKKAKDAKDDELRPEYKRSDLGRGTRGKFYKSYREGTNAVLLSPNVAAVFPDEASVNEALRSLIEVANRAAGLKRPSAGQGKKRAA